MAIYVFSLELVLSVPCYVYSIELLVSSSSVVDPPAAAGGGGAWVF